MDKNGFLSDQNDAINSIIDELVEQPVNESELESAKKDLYEVLETQWNLLDIVFESDKEKEKADAAIEAQLLNSGGVRA